MGIIDRLSTLLNLLLPQKCLSCDKIGELLCESCLYKLPKEQSPYGVTTIFPYSDPVVRQAIWLLKYRGVNKIVEPLARVVYEKIVEELADLSELHQNKEKIIIVPVPLSKERERERGFNQTMLLAKEIVRIDSGRSLEFRPDILKKVTDTPSQVSIKNRAERIKNLKDAFVLENKTATKNKVVVLLDDVTTTGATLNECAKVLRRAHPRLIFKLAVAH